MCRWPGSTRCALLRLKATGSCEVEVPEWLFDMDTPGVYMRRLKTVAVTIPAVTGPYAGIHCALSLLRSSVRFVRGRRPVRAQRRRRGCPVPRLHWSDPAMVTSGAQNDSGLFETNLRDERYLPFEGAGAISTWRLELPIDLPQFDVESISDVVFHLRYTAREAGTAAATGGRRTSRTRCCRTRKPLQLFTLNYDFGKAWHALRGGHDADRKLRSDGDDGNVPVLAKEDGYGRCLGCDVLGDRLRQGKARRAPRPRSRSPAMPRHGWTLDVTQGSPVFPFLKKHAPPGLRCICRCPTPSAEAARPERYSGGVEATSRKARACRSARR